MTRSGLFLVTKMQLIMRHSEGRLAVQSNTVDEICTRLHDECQYSGQADLGVLVDHLSKYAGVAGRGPERQETAVETKLSLHDLYMTIASLRKCLLSALQTISLSKTSYRGTVWL